NMMIDCGAQVSLVGTNVLHANTVINPNKKVQITSIHGTEVTLGEVGANIVYDNMQIPVNFQVLKKCPVPEDGIIGFDVLKPFATINGPNEKITWSSNEQNIKVPLKIRYGTGSSINTIRNSEVEDLTSNVNESNAKNMCEKKFQEIELEDESVYSFDTCDSEKLCSDPEVEKQANENVFEFEKRNNRINEDFGNVLISENVNNTVETKFKNESNGQ
ncbi:hypothetical protein ACFFRR_005450, partial [Megaselia abdita]